MSGIMIRIGWQNIFSDKTYLEIYACIQCPYGHVWNDIWICTTNLTLQPSSLISTSLTLSSSSSELTQLPHSLTELSKHTRMTHRPNNDDRPSSGIPRTSSPRHHHHQCCEWEMSLSFFRNPKNHKTCAHKFSSAKVPMKIYSCEMSLLLNGNQRSILTTNLTKSNNKIINSSQNVLNWVESSRINIDIGWSSK